MTIKAVLDSDQFGELDESLQGLYKEQDDSYVLDLDGVDDLPSVKGLRNAMQNAKKEKGQYRDTADSLKKRFGPLVDIEDLDLSDVDPERVEQMRPYLTGEQEIPEPGEKQQKVDVDKIKANATKPFEKKLSETEERLQETTARLHQHVRDSALTEALSKNKVAEPYFDAAMAMFRSRIKVIEDDGKLVPVIDDDAAGELPVDKFVKEWAQTDQGKAFIEAAGNQGGGARGGGDKGGLKNPWSPEHWNMTEQARIYREKPERAQQMAAQYGKKVGA